MMPAAATSRRPARWLPAHSLMNTHRNATANAPGSRPAPYHRPALLSETMAALAVRSGGVYIDGTLGDGGHTRQILQLSAPHGITLGIDRDPRTLDAARQRLHQYGNRLIAQHGSYADLAPIAAAHGLAAVDGILLDLGFSSRQVDQPGYGFSFQTDEPLDLRYDTAGPSAADLVNSAAAPDLADLIYRYGEERRSRAVARSIIANRPIHTTGQLAEIVARAVGGGSIKGRRGRHPATRTFQALRIAVNQELEHLEKGLDAAAKLLAAAVGGLGGYAGERAEMLFGDGQEFAAAVELLAGVFADEMVAVDDGEKFVDRVAADVAEAFGEAVADGGAGFGQVVNDAVLNAGGGRRTGAQGLQFAFRAQARHDGENLAGADVNGGKYGFPGHCQFLPVSR